MLTENAKSWLPANTWSHGSPCHTQQPSKAEKSGSALSTVKINYADFIYPAQKCTVR